MRLYELTEAYMDLVSMLDDCQSESEMAAVLSEIESVSECIADKGEYYARLIRNWQAEATAYEAEEKRLKKLRQVRENAVDRLKNNLLYAMGIAGATELTTSIGKWKIQKNPISVVVMDETKVPEEFTVPQPAKIVKAAILNHFGETGEIPEGCDIVQSEGVRFR